MSSGTISRNFASALFELADRQGKVELYGDLLETVAAAVLLTPEVKAVMMSPRVPKAKKVALLTEALPEAPKAFLRFLEAVVRRGRQNLLGEMAEAYRELADIRFNRVRASVTLAHAPDDALAERIAAGLSRVFGKEVLPVFRTDPGVLGGAIVRVGDRVFDGSVKRKVAALRRQLLSR